MGSKQSDHTDKQPAGNVRAVIAGGGTGGHLFPGVAIAAEFKTRFPEEEIVFISTGNPLEVRILQHAGYRLEKIPVEGLKGRGLWRQIRSLWKIPKALWASGKLLRMFRPKIVVGVGGYASGPVGLSAWMKGIPLVLHEQNRLPGITNRILSRLATCIFVSFPESRENFPAAKAMASGNPVRRELLEAMAVERSDKPTDVFHLLIVGGSQGAHRINTAMVEACRYLGNPERFRVRHQTGEADVENVEKGYRETGIDHEVRPFFDDMAARYREADLVVCRAGATTVAEITAIGKAVIFIPFPHAADNHQEINAAALVSAGAAEMIRESELDGQGLARRIEHYASHREELADMAAQARAMGNPKAASVIVAACNRIIAGETVGQRHIE